MGSSLLAVNDLSIAFIGAGSFKPIVEDINFFIDRGKTLALVGESGSGKTLTAMSIMQLLPIGAQVCSKASIEWQGEDILFYSEQQMRHLRGGDIAMIFQDAMSAFHPTLTIGAQMLESIIRHTTHRGQYARDCAETLLHDVGIDDVSRTMHAYAHQLSGGMRQRAMIAMALVASPKLLIADEPSTSLDVSVQAQVLDLLLSLQKKHKMAMLFISHDLAVVSQVADDVLVMRGGSCVEQASAKSFFNSPQAAYSKNLLAAVPSLICQRSVKEEPFPTVMEVKNLKVHYPIRRGVFKRVVDHVKAVDGVDLKLSASQTLALVGESGSGKTTIAKALFGLVDSTHDAFHVNSALNDEKNLPYATSPMQMIFQDPYAAINPRMMVYDVVAEGLRVLRWPESAIKSRVTLIMDQVGLDSAAQWRYPHQFSGGQRQRICIARALVCAPKILVLDEPTSSLDVSVQKQVLDLLLDLQSVMKLSYVLITHHLAVVAQIADHVVVMRHGKVVESGTTSSVLNHPQQSYTKQLLAVVPRIQGVNHEKKSIRDSIQYPFG